MRTADLIEKYRPYIVMPHKGGIEMAEHLRNKLDCTETVPFAGDAFLKKMVVENVTYCILNTEGKTESDFRFKQFLIEPTERNMPYYQGMEREWETVYVIVEMETGYLFSNCQKLLLELLIEQGIDSEDLETGNILCKCYLGYIKGYLELWDKRL